MKRVYRSAKGQTVDMEALRKKNEDVIASGNMKVNAKGDELGPGGHVVRNVSERARAAQKTPKKTVEKASLKPKITAKEERATEPAPKDEPTGEVKTREDGSQYMEIFDDEGNLETTELKPATKKKKGPSK